MANGSVVTLGTGVVIAQGDFDLRGALTVPTGVTLDITQTLFLRSGAALTNSGTVTRAACVVEAGVTISGVNPCP